MSRQTSGDGEKGFGARLREARLARGWTQPQLSRATYDATGGRVDLTPGEISRYETGRVQNPSLEKVAGLAAALGEPVSAFTGALSPADRLAAVEELAGRIWRLNLDGFATIRKLLDRLPDEIATKLVQAERADRQSRGPDDSGTQRKSKSRRSGTG